MNLEYVESLALKARNDDNFSKEKIIEEFTPYILGISKKIHLHGYDYNDIVNECYSYLLIALNKYNTDKHRFVAYATITIKNNLYYLVRKTLNTKIKEISLTKIIAYDDPEDINKNLIRNDEIDIINDSIKSLNSKEYDLFKNLIINNQSIKTYAYNNNLLYQTVYYRRKKLLNKIENLLADSFI